MGNNVYVIDDDDLMVAALTSLLGDVGYRVTGFSGAESFISAHPEPEGVIIIDLRLKGMSGRWLQERLQTSNRVEFIFISGVAEVDDAVVAMKSGAHDFLVKPFRPQVMIDAVSGAFQKLKRNQEKVHQIGEGKACYELLTRREREIASLMLEGLRNKQIAYHTGRSENTIKVHRSRILRKVGASSILDLSKKLEGIVDPVHPGSAN
jgi:FixJ family two-component response regulator